MKADYILARHTRRQRWESRNGIGLTEHICSVSQFLFRLRVQLRYGELTRAPLKLLRLALVADSVECDWLARAQDPWDVELPARVGPRHASLQALRDAIDVRFLLFRSFSTLETAYIRIYRDSSDNKKEMIVTGCVQRNDNSSRRLHSLAMRARVLGFRFHFEDDILFELPKGGSPFLASEMYAP
jgi:hypothetical protein